MIRRIALIVLALVFVGAVFADWIEIGRAHV